MKYIRLCSGITLLYITFVVHTAWAAAWNLEKGKSQILATYTYYQTDEFFDKSGNRKSQLEFTKKEQDVLYEYGLNNNITLGLHPRFQSVTQDRDAGNISNQGFSSIDFLGRWHAYDRQNVFSEGDSFVFSIQPLIKIPGPESNNTQLPISTKQWDFELRALAGYSFKYYDLYHFLNLELGYKKRDGLPSDEIVFDSTVGVRFLEDWMILGQLFHTSSIREEGKSALSLINSLDFSITKVQFSVVKKFSERYSVQLGIFDNLFGENTGAGNGGLLSVWVDF